MVTPALIPVVPAPPSHPEFECPDGTGPIARLAFTIWDRGGKPEGQFLRHWLLAEAELAKAEATRFVNS
ncbi:MAG: DUF2934 domain-containing protein [Planctomycetota bacterium]|nr:DUF2934 domain-containing protein [Planctomycetota bacterium]